MKKIHTCSGLLAFCLLAPALGQVVLQDSYAPEFPGGPPSELDDGAGPFGYEIDVTDDFSAAGHGKLIMVYSSKDEDGGDFGGAPVDRVTYAGVPLVEAFFSANDSVLTTDADGEGTVQLTLSGNAADFLRARSAP